MGLSASFRLLFASGFLLHKACAQLSISILRQLSDSILLDFDVAAYGEFVEGAMQDLTEAGTIQRLEDIGVDTEAWSDAAQDFVNATKEWQANFDANKDEYERDPLLARVLNDQMSKLDRTFILEQGLPNRPEYRHVIISPPVTNTYGSGAFPGVTALLAGWEASTSDDERQEGLKQLRMHVSDVVMVLNRARYFLGDVGEISWS